MTTPRHASGAGAESHATEEARQGRPGQRLAVLAVVVALACVGGLAGNLAGGNPPAAVLRSPSLVADAAPVSSQSSSWYCAGIPGPAGSLGQSEILLVNTAQQAVSATVDAVGTRGHAKHELVTVPAHGQLAVAPGSLAPSAWLAARVDVAGGGVSASVQVDGSAGWTAAPCASETAPQWYFAAGSTSTGTSLRLSVFNPGANLAVVDLSFVTAAGVTQPQPFQGIVLNPGASRSVTVGQYVQDHPQVAAVVTARSGAVVATELQSVQAGGVTGLGLRLGSPVLARTWYLPRAEDASGGTSAVTVYNPSRKTQTVSVRVRLPSGPVAPFTDKLAPGGVWTLDTAQQVRIPSTAPYAMTVEASGGPGVVVDRTTAGPSGSPSPGWGDDAAVASVSTQATRWTVAAVNAPGSAGAAAITLVLMNPGRLPVAALVSSLTSTGVHRVSQVTVKAESSVTLAAGTTPLLVTAAGQLAVVGDASPTGAPATALEPAIPQS